MRPLACLVLAGLLAGCQAAPGPRQPAGDAAGLALQKAACVASQLFADAARCRRAPAAPVLERPSRYCYPTIGAVDCYAAPDPDRRRRALGTPPATSG